MVPTVPTLEAPPGRPPVHADADEANAQPLAPPPKTWNVEELVDMTAMVDIVFFLLIFFMVTSMAGLSSSIGMPNPAAQRTTARARQTIADFEQDADYAIVHIDRDNTIWFNGVEIPSGQELRVKLREAKRGANPPRRLLVVGSGEAKNATVVTVLDAGNDVGMEEIRLAVDEKE